MPICGNCNQYDLTRNDWFCRHCGDRRETCPSCGASMGTEECESCGQPRYGPCTECGELTPVNEDACRHCGYDDVEAMRSRSWKFLAAGVVLGGVGLFVLPAVLGTVLGYLFGIPILLVGIIATGLGAFELLAPTRTGPVGEVGLSIGEKEHMSEEYSKQLTKDAVEAVGTAAAAGASALDSYSEYKQDKREREQKREAAREAEREQRAIERGRQRIEDAAREARESHLTVLWEMNCEGCGIPWLTTQNRHLVRNDEFDTVGFTVVNEEEWNYIQDRVRLQCDAPDCTRTATFTKDSLWDP